MLAFVHRIVRYTSVPIPIVERVLNAAIGALVVELKEKRPVVLPGIGRLVVRKAAPRVARNIHTGERIDIPERYVLRLEPAERIKELINNGEEQKKEN